MRMRDAAIEGNHHAEEEDRRREREAPASRRRSCSGRAARESS